MKKQEKQNNSKLKIIPLGGLEQRYEYYCL